MNFQNVLVFYTENCHILCKRTLFYKIATSIANEMTKITIIPCKIAIKVVCRGLELQHVACRAPSPRQDSMLARQVACAHFCHELGARQTTCCNLGVQQVVCRGLGSWHVTSTVILHNRDTIFFILFERLVLLFRKKHIILAKTRLLTTVRVREIINLSPAPTVRNLLLRLTYTRGFVLFESVLELD